ncbi:MAG: class I mannose-6-phosphate isomerase [Lachnospiraceae bacterium]|nr:class I mannose-6-phosphate isomerase [Lachnospiraceae bacterium]
MNKPFLCKPYGKDYLWGGRRLQEEMGKETELSPLAESWECSTHPDGPSMAADGIYAGMELTEILTLHPEYLGSHVRKTGDEGVGQLPVLVKFIDAKQDLSVQVHPTDDYAREFENGQSGKSELWYILDAAKDAKIVYGLRYSTEKDTLREAIQDGTLEKYLQKVPVEKDQVFFVEAGTIHAVGAGCLIAEIQENSNLTYRLYDYDRVDKSGEKRPLHIEKGLETASLKTAPEPRQPIRVLRYTPGCARELLGRCRYFEVYRMLVNTEKRQVVCFRADELSFRVLLCIDGCGILTFEDTVMEIYKGDCIFVPADSVEIRMHGKFQFLDIRC